MAAQTPARRTLAAGLVLTALGGALLALLGGGFVVLLPGLALCVAAATISRTPRGRVVVAFLVGGLVLLPFATVSVLYAVDTDPLAIFLVGLGLFSLAGVAALTFLVVLLISGSNKRRPSR